MKTKGFSIEEIKKKLEYYCVYQERCHKEVEQKMASFNLIPQARELLLLHLLENDFLNEERFAKSFARGKFNQKHWGKKRIVRELEQRNISAYNIKSALQEINENDYVEKIMIIAKKRNEILTERNLLKRKKKLFDFLYRKGYETDLIYETISKVITIALLLFYN